MAIILFCMFTTAVGCAGWYVGFLIARLLWRLVVRLAGPVRVRARAKPEHTRPTRASDDRASITDLGAEVQP